MNKHFLLLLAIALSSLSASSLEDELTEHKGAVATVSTKRGFKDVDFKEAYRDTVFHLKHLRLLHMAKDRETGELYPMAFIRDMEHIEFPKGKFQFLLRSHSLEDMRFYEVDITEPKIKGGFVIL